MNAHSHLYGAWYPGEGGMPSAPTGTPSLVLRPRRWARFADRLAVEVSAWELAALAGGPDAAICLASMRGYLADSAENHRMAELLRNRPWDFVAAGAPLVLGAETVHPLADGGVERIEGFQRLVVLSHISREV